MKKPKFVLSSTVVVCALLATIIGGGIALASLVSWDLESGYKYYYGYYSFDVGGLEYSYNIRDYIWRSSDSTAVAVYNTRYYNGWANTGDIYFGYQYIWDEGVNNVKWWYWGDDVDGVDRTQATAWYYEYLDETNNYVVSEQYVMYDAGGGASTIEVDTAACYTGIGPR